MQLATAMISGKDCWEHRTDATISAILLDIDRGMHTTQTNIHVMN
jgi:hypothetical protein